MELLTIVYKYINKFINIDALISELKRYNATKANDDIEGLIKELEQIKKETSRCLGCGATIVDANKCIGCGICTTKCDFDAIKLHRDHPECSTMTVAEDKFKAIIPYQLKRVKNIILKKKVEH